MLLSALRLRLLVAALLAVSFLGALDHTVVSTSLATIAGSLGALEQLSWIVVGYTLAATVMLPVLGKLGDLLGPSRVFIACLVAFVAASFVCGMASDMGWLIAGRVVQGVGSAGLQLMSQTIIAEVTTPRERPRYMAVIGAAFPVAIVVGPVLGGVITDLWGWPWVFWLNVPVGLVALALVLVAVPRIPARARPRFDVPGAVLFTLTLVALVLGVTWLGDTGLAVEAVVALGLAVAGFAALVVVERRAAEPILPFTLFRHRTVAAGLALSAVIGIGLFAVTSYLPTYFQMAYRTSATVSGLVPIATVMGMLVSNLVSGFLVSRSGYYRPYPIVGTALAAVGLVAMSMLPVGAPLWVPMLIMAVVGLGTGAFMNLVYAVVQSAAPRDQLGAVTASLNLVRQVGSTVATAVIGGVVGAGVAAGLPAALDAATLTPQAVHAAVPEVQARIASLYHDLFSPIFVGMAVVYGLGLLAALTLRRERLPDAEPVPLEASASAI
ncbi:MAG: MFS transporter [Microbacterium sp.]|uniref:MFS transporter n=1 Tax=Microbacterium sp. TaxID=51671 RepID=UPI0039E60001